MRARTFGAFVCALSYCATHGAEARAESATTSSTTWSSDAPRWFAATATAPEVVVYPPRDGVSAPHPVTVLLHGMCDVPENECPWFANVVARDSWLVCPRGPLRCASGGATWGYEHRSALIDAAIGRVEEEFPGRVAAGTADTLIGFSLGAFVAMDVVNRSPARWARVVLLGAKIAPDTRALLHGATRFVLGAGDFDMSHSHMELVARHLRAAGVDATYSSLGRVGHRFADDMDGWLAAALAPREREAE